MSGAVQDGPSGLGGWLILPLIGWVVTLGATGFNVIAALADPDVLLILRDPPPGLPEGVRPAMLASLAAGLLLGASCIACLVALFGRRRRMVALATVHFLLLAAAGGIEFGAAQVMAEALRDPSIANRVWQDLLRGVIAAAIWIPYFHRSRRVANTFIR